jgi:hypothetical protein
MKNTKLIIALAAALCLASCDFGKPGTNEEPTNVDTVVATALSKVDEVEEVEEVVVTINEDGLPGLSFGSEIPETLEGCTIEPQTYMAEGEEQIKYVVKKGDELVMEIEPGFDFGTMEFTKTVEVINIYSDRYQDSKQFHVGSNANDVLAAYPDLLTSLTANDDICMDLGGTQFMVAPEDYDGKLPEIMSDEGAIIRNPTFKPEATVKMIRLYNMK